MSTMIRKIILATFGLCAFLALDVAAQEKKSITLYYSEARKDFFTSASEAGDRNAKAAAYVVSDAKSQGKIWKTQKPGTVPLLAYWSAKHQDCLTMTADIEALKLKEGDGYQPYETLGYIYKEKSLDAQIPLVLYKNASTNDFLTTAMPPGNLVGIKHFDAKKYELLGCIGYVVTAQSVSDLKNSGGVLHYKGVWDWNTENTSNFELDTNKPQIKYTYQHGDSDPLVVTLPYSLVDNEKGHAVLEFALPDGNHAQFVWTSFGYVKGKFWLKGVAKTANPATRTTMERVNLAGSPARARTEHAEKPRSKTQLETFFNTYGGRSRFSSHYIDAVTAFVTAEDEVKGENYSGAKAILDDLWRKYPIGDDSWKRAGSGIHGTFVASPVAYPGLRMLTDVVNYQLHKPSNVYANTLNMKVVLVGKAEGTMPRNLGEFAGGTGVQTVNHLDTRLRKDNYRLIKEVTDVFRRYITAVTDGKLVVALEILELPQVTAPIIIEKKGNGKTGHAAKLSDSSKVYDGIPDKVKADTDLWWIIYPSFVPGTGRNNAVARREAFEGYGFITGGMYMGKQKALVCDDLFFLDKQPVLDTRMSDVFTELEQRCYPPQWFQHEFFHYLYNMFPSFPSEPAGLEPTSHDWFTRSFWPRDFQGMYEADFYQESMHKRIKRVRERPLHVRLRRKVEIPPKSVYAQLRTQDVLGNYQAESKNLNDWHYIRIYEENGKYFWMNRANVKWELTPLVSDGIIKSSREGDWRIVLKVDESSGKFLPKVVGIRRVDGRGVLVVKK